MLIFCVFSKSSDFTEWPLKPTAVGKGKFFFSIFFNFLAELYHFKTFGEKKIFSKNFQKTLFGNFDHEGGLKSFLNIYRKFFSMGDFGGTELEKFEISPKM